MWGGFFGEVVSDVRRGGLEKAKQGGWGNGIISSFCWLSNIPLYVDTTPSIPTPLLMDTSVASGLGYCK